MALIRIAKGATATLTHTFYVDESPTPATGSVTVSAVDATGASVFSSTATAAGTGYAYTMAGRAALASLTVTWAGTVAGASVSEADTVEIVGGYFFSLAEGRASDTSLADTAKYTTADLVAARTETETEAEYICARAFVPRYRRVILDGSGGTDLLLPDPDVRSIRSASVAPRADGTFVALSAAQLAALVVTGDSTIQRVDGAWWTEGLRNVLMEYEYGLDGPPPDLVRAAKIRFRSRLNLTRTGIPDRAVSFSAADGGTYRLSLPDAYRTGIPEVDAAYGRYSRRVQAVGGAGGQGQGGARYPASRQLNFDPQRYALFHGGRR